MSAMKPNTIPSQYEDTATLSTWIKRYPMLAHHTKLLRNMPISARCAEQYPDIVASLHPESIPMVISLPVVQEYGKGVAA